MVLIRYCPPTCRVPQHLAKGGVASRTLRLGVLSDKKEGVEDWSDGEGGGGSEDGEVSGCEGRNQLEVDSCEFFELLR